jgi:hypothetical protein
MAAKRMLRLAAPAGRTVGTAPSPPAGVGQAQRAHLSREIMKARHGSVRIGDDPGGAAVLTLTFRPLP